jgi:acetyltransferase-like isoleucine patch superfamily enzyme
MKTNIILKSNKFFTYIKNIILLRIKGVKVDLNSKIIISKDSKIIFGKKCVIRRGIINVGPNSTLIIGHTSLISGYINIQNGSHLETGSHFKIIGGSIIMDDNSTLISGNYNIIEQTGAERSMINISNGKMTTGLNTCMRGVISINPGGQLDIGSNTFLNNGSEIRCADKTSIGNYVYISYYVDIFDTNTHPLDWKYRRKERDDAFPNNTITQYKLVKTAPIIIGDDVWIGKSVSILKGVKIFEKSIVGTRSVVTQSCLKSSVLAGNPARVVKNLL